MGIDLESLLKPIAGPEPSGPDLRGEIDAFEAELFPSALRLAPTPTEALAEPRNWAVIQEKCLAMAGRTRNLKVGGLLTLIGLEVEGVAGFRDGLKLIHQYLERFWDDVHPRLDPEDKDPDIRRVRLELLSPAGGGFEDQWRVPYRLKGAALCRSSALGPVSLGDIEAVERAAEATSSVAVVETPRLEMAAIKEAFAGAESTQLDQTEALLKESGTLLEGITSVFAKRAGEKYAPSFRALSDAVASALEAMRRVRRSLLQGGAGGGTESGGGSSSDGGGGGVAGGGATSRLNTKSDLKNALRQIQSAFARIDPSSPAPLFLEAAIRLSDMTFVEIVKEFTGETLPPTLAELKKMAGKN